MSGTKTPANLCTMPSSGSAAGLQNTCDSLKEKGLHGQIPPKDRASHRRLFLRDENQVDPGQCPRSKGARRDRRASLRNSGNMAHLETHEGSCACDGLFQRFPHMLFNINTLEWDDEILEELGIPKCILPEVKTVKLHLRRDRSFFPGRQDPHRRSRRGSAGCPFRSDLF